MINRLKPAPRATLLRAAPKATGKTAATVVRQPTLHKKPVPADALAAAKDLLRLSDGNDVSIASFTATPAELTAIAQQKSALNRFLEKVGMNISAAVPESDDAQQSVKPFSGDLASAIYTFAEVPQSSPPTAQSRAAQARARADAAVLARELKKTGGDVYLVNWNNQDDTNVNILVAMNKRSGRLTVVKTFPAV